MAHLTATAGYPRKADHFYRRPPVTHIGIALRTMASQYERKTACKCYPKFTEVNT